MLISFSFIFLRDGNGHSWLQGNSAQLKSLLLGIRYTYGIGIRTAISIVRKVGLGEEGLISLARQN